MQSRRGARKSGASCASACYGGSGHAIVIFCIVEIRVAVIPDNRRERRDPILHRAYLSYPIRLHQSIQPHFGLFLQDVPEDHFLDGADGPLVLPDLRIPLLYLLGNTCKGLGIALFHPFLHCLTFNTILTRYLGKDSTVRVTAEIKFCQFHIFGCR